MNEIGKYDFKVRQGETHIETFTDWLIDGNALNLSATVAIVHFKRASNIQTPDLSLTVANGGLVITGNNMEFHFGANTLGLSPGVYLYDILLIIDGKRYTYVEGQMVLMGVITK